MGDENVLKLEKGGECAKFCPIIHFKTVNFILGEFYLNFTTGAYQKGLGRKAFLDDKGHSRSHFPFLELFPEVAAALGLPVMAQTSADTKVIQQWPRRGSHPTAWRVGQLEPGKPLLQREDHTGLGILGTVAGAAATSQGT